MPPKKVSVIVPVYNAEKYIHDCIKSIINQTLDDIELIIVDDGSTDGTSNILDAYAGNFNWISVYHQDNKGLYKSREIGLKFATGDYIGWVDADDYIMPTMYEKLYTSAVENDSELVICNYDFFPKRISTKKKWFQPYRGKVDVSFVEQNSQPWNKLVKRDLIERLGIAKHFTDCHDEIYIKVLMEAKNPLVINDVLYMYRSYGGMSTSYKNVEHYKKFVVASENLLKIMSCPTLELYWKDYFLNRITYYLLMTMIVAANAGNKGEYDSAKRRLLNQKPRYKKNQHYWNILKSNYGYLRALVIDLIIPNSYLLSRFICKIALK